jgi:hypothetical protein
MELNGETRKRGNGETENILSMMIVNVDFYLVNLGIWESGIP